MPAPMTPDPMPEVLRVWLLMLNQAEANAVWDYLDENPHALDDMIELLAGLIAALNRAPGEGH